MSAGATLVLAVCEGGGNNSLAFFVVLAVGALYALAVGSVIAKADDGAETAALLVLLMISIAVGALFFLYPHGINGDGNFLGRLLVSLTVNGVIALGVLVKLGDGSPSRVLFVTLAGDLLIPGGIFVLFFASLGIGTGCLA